MQKILHSAISSVPVLNRKEILFYAAKYLHGIMRMDNLSKKILSLLRLALSTALKIVFYPFAYKNNLIYLISLGWNEDLILSAYSSRILPEFCIPSFDIAARFSLEQEPKLIHSLIEFDIPFGCHAWEKYDYNYLLNAFSSEFTANEE